MGNPPPSLLRSAARLPLAELPIHHQQTHGLVADSLQLLDDLAGGMLHDDRPLKAVIPGGSSVPVLRADECDVNMYYDSLAAKGSMLGSAAVMVMDSSTCMVNALLRIAHFYAHESCGQCTPCREGLPWVVDLLRAIEEGHAKREDLNLLPEFIETMAPGHPFCDLASGAMEPLVSALKHFRDDFEQHIDRQQCPWR